MIMAFGGEPRMTGPAQASEDGHPGSGDPSRNGASAPWTALAVPAGRPSRSKAAARSAGSGTSVHAVLLNVSGGTRWPASASVPGRDHGSAVQATGCRLRHAATRICAVPARDGPHDTRSIRVRSCRAGHAPPRPASGSRRQARSRLQSAPAPDAGLPWTLGPRSRETAVRPADGTVRWTSSRHLS